MMDKVASARENATLKSRCEEGEEKIRKLTMDKAASAKEVATLKSRCEEGDEKIRKLTMDKETWPLGGRMRMHN